MLEWLQHKRYCKPWLEGFQNVDSLSSYVVKVKWSEILVLFRIWKRPKKKSASKKCSF